MSGDPLDRRQFLVVAGIAIGGAAAVGASWLLRSDPIEAAPSSSSTSSAPPTTTTSPPTSTTATTAVPMTTTDTPPPETTATTSNTIPPGPAAIEVICKSAWGAKAVTGEFISHTIENITVHHTAVALTTNAAAPARARQHQSYHQELGWPDLAYHYLIDANGHVYEGRPVTAVGDTATDYDPTGHFLVCCEGDFNTQQITAEQYQSLVRLLAWGSVEFGVTAASIRGHRDVASTTCPGDNLYLLIADGTIAADVAATIASGVPALDVVCGQVAADLVAAIESGSI